MPITTWGWRVRPDTWLAGCWIYLQRIWQFRYFWFSLVCNDLRQRYRHSFLGLGWSLARPLLLTVVFCIVFSHLFRVPIHEYAPYLLVGMTVWQFLTETVTHGCKCFLIAAAYLKQQQLPLAIFPLRTVLMTGFHALVALGLALVVTWFFQGLNLLVILPALLPGLLLLALLGWFLALLCGLLHTWFPDTQNLLEIGMQVLFYLTPVLYRPEHLGEHGRLAWLVQLNPLTSVLELIRRPLLEGNWPALVHLQMAVLLLAGLGGLALVALRRLERTLVFWV